MINAPWYQRRSQTKSSRQGDHRNPFQRDKARILHSAAFRRLQSKTQVLGVGIGDFYRTRLTHSLEASQIGQGIAAQIRAKHPQLSSDLGLNDQLIEALCLAHDIGHPPFGHGGEVALHFKMHQHGGFEGNGQTFRIVSKLEPYTAEDGMNLSRRTILGLVKYPNYIDSLANTACYQTVENHRQVIARDWHPPKGLYQCDSEVFDWLLSPLTDNDQQLIMSNNVALNKHAKTRYKSFDCSIMELADDIAYGIHDLEDAIVMGIVRRHHFEDEVVSLLKQLNDFSLCKQLDVLTDKLFSPNHYERKDAIGAFVNAFITAIDVSKTEALFDEPILQYNACFPEVYSNALSAFKSFVYLRVIQKPDIQIVEYRGQQIVMELFDALASDPMRLLPENTRARWLKAQQDENGHRVISDYISGMTDGFASKLYTNLFLPNANVSVDHL